MTSATSSLRLLARRPQLRTHVNTSTRRYQRHQSSQQPPAQKPPEQQHQQQQQPNAPSNHPLVPPKSTTDLIPGPAWVWLEPIAVPFRAYGRAQKKRPYITQFISSLIIYFCGDLSAQSIAAEEEQQYDPYRTLRALIIGGISSIPSYRWFMWLGNSFNYAGSRVLSLLTKVVVNQTLFTPLFNTYFFGMQALLSGDTLAGTWERIKLAVPVSVYNSCKLWPAVTAFSFTFVAPQYRNVFAGVIAVGWQTYLSLLNQRAARVEALERAEKAASVVRV